MDSNLGVYEIHVRCRDQQKDAYSFHGIEFSSVTRIQ